MPSHKIPCTSHTAFILAYISPSNLSLQAVTASAHFRRSSICPSFSSSISELRDNNCTHLPEHLSAKQHIDFHAVHLSRERLLFSSHQCPYSIQFSSIPSRILFLFYIATITTVQGGCRLAPISITGDTDTGKPKEPSILINSIYPRIHSPRSRDPRFRKILALFFCLFGNSLDLLYISDFLYCFITGLACFPIPFELPAHALFLVRVLFFYFFFFPCGWFGWERSMIPEDWAQVRGIRYGCWSLLSLFV